MLVVTGCRQSHTLKIGVSLLNHEEVQGLGRTQPILAAAEFRCVEGVLASSSITNGGGVKLKRAFAEDKLFDPFLLLDEFRSQDPRDYSAGFPWHPHRGFETVTYMLEGALSHEDSVGNGGTIYAGDVQWMTAGRGVVHQEMPRGDRDGWLRVLQLWVNLPTAAKMIEPKYRGFNNALIPEVQANPDVRARVICGSILNVTGPVRGLAVNCQFLDIAIQPNGIFEHAPPRSHRVFAYVLDGEGLFDMQQVDLVGSEHTVIYGGGERIRIQAGNSDFRCLLFSGEPLMESVAWRGSVVMNTQEELDKAYEELQKGDFLKKY